MRALRIAVAVETVSLAVLLVNLFTVHVAGLASLVGPLHGGAYLAVIACTVLVPGSASTGARWRSWIPVIGGLLAVRRLRPAAHRA
ncbi:hypothetical protein HD597_007256 [Nonomuraea thailandensis]|uniref:DUF3817 domain-containing protein n=1 Tax=Nonomuraea thailandensis TaxID=1188745 RepID=A0A9X2K7X4_9ACTN|nr:hypothetical protein [Nonomuraea thailandensis]MCP2360236.1 hypothetical protein [Nonomuraea thailandensis]